MSRDEGSELQRQHADLREGRRPVLLEQREAASGWRGRQGVGCDGGKCRWWKSSGDAHMHAHTHSP